MTNSINWARYRRPALSLVALVVLIGYYIWQQQGSADTEPSSDPQSSPSAEQTSGANSGSADGLPTVELDDLPPEAEDTVELIDSDGPYPYDKDGSTFGNFEGLLPDHQRGYYEEYTVETPGSNDRGARRIILADDGTLYWTDDHYESFSRITR